MHSCSQSFLFIPPKRTQYIKYIYLSSTTSYMFWCLLHHLQADHYVTCSKTTFSLQCCYKTYNIPCFFLFRVHSHCKPSRAEPNRTRFGLENKPTLWNGSIHTARRTELGRAWPSMFTGWCLFLLASRRPMLLRDTSNFLGLSACFVTMSANILDCEVLINAVYLRPALWVQSDKNYQNRDLKLKLWEEMAAVRDSSCTQKCYFLIYW